MHQQTYNIDIIKEQITYFVLNSLKNECDPSDERLKEIISDVISIDRRAPDSYVAFCIRKHFALLIPENTARIGGPAVYRYNIAVHIYHSAMEPSSCRQTGFFQLWGVLFSSRTSSLLTSTPMPGFTGRFT